MEISSQLLYFVGILTFCFSLGYFLAKQQLNTTPQRWNSHTTYQKSNVSVEEKPMETSSNETASHETPSDKIACEETPDFSDSVQESTETPGKKRIAAGKALKTASSRATFGLVLCGIADACLVSVFIPPVVTACAGGVIFACKGAGAAVEKSGKRAQKDSNGSNGEFKVMATDLAKGAASKFAKSELKAEIEDVQRHDGLDAPNGLERFVEGVVEEEVSLDGGEMFDFSDAVESLGSLFS